ncbi:MAG: methyltransferase [Flavobacteriales bacterium]|nr:MAG: methyltransferase [Flavobacteriales bacterium]
MDFLPEELENFILKNTEKEPSVLAELNHETWEKVLIPRMLSGHLQGRVLSMLSHMINPKNILEIGTYTGYSAICMAEGLQKGGKIHTIDINEELETMVNDYIEKSNLKNTIINHIGNAIDIIPTLTEPIDLVFIDADKTNYSNYYDLVFDKVSTGGYIIADNVLWSGKVTEEKEKLDPDTIALIDYSEKVNNDDRVQNVLFPIRDGLMIVRKK